MKSFHSCIIVLVLSTLVTSLAFGVTEQRKTGQTDPDIASIPVLSGTSIAISGDNTNSAMVNVRAYLPAKLLAAIEAGTNTTDLSPYVQKAANAAAGRILLFPKGIYHFDNVSLSLGTVVQGVGGTYRGICSVRSLRNNSAVFKITHPNYNITIRDIEIASNNTNPTLITGRRGLLFEGSVNIGAIWNYTIENVTFRNLNRGLSVEDLDYRRDPRGWMIDSVRISRCQFVENIVGIYCNAGNATNVTVDTSPLGMWPVSEARGVDLPSYGSFTFINVWAGGPNNPRGMGIGFHLGLGANTTFINCGNEGPKIGIQYDGAGPVVYDRPINLINGSWGRIILNASNTFVSMGNWFNDNVVFQRYAGDAVWHSTGDRFSAGNDFRPYKNSFVHYTSGKRRFLNASGYSSPSMVSAITLRQAAADQVRLNGGPDGIYRFSAAISNTVDNNRLSCKAYWHDINGGGSKNKELFGRSYAIGEYSADWTVGHIRGKNLSLSCSSSEENAARLTAVIEIISPTAAWGNYW